MIRTLLFIISPLLVIIAIADWLSRSPEQKILFLHRQGYSQQRIANRLQVSRYKVRKTLRKL